MTVHSTEGLGFETRQLHAGQTFDNDAQARITPIYLSAGFLFDDFEQARDRFSGDEPGFIYSRNNNPTNAVAERRLTSLDGGAATILTGSGQAAVATAILALAGSGDHVLVAPSIYEGSRGLFRRDLTRRGIEFEFLDDQNDPDDWARRIRPNTKALFAESIPNPKNEVLDIAAVADVGHTAGVPLVIDNTIATPYLVRPGDHGAAVVAYSASKLLTGHGASVAGAIVDTGVFDWAANRERFPQFSAPYKGVVGNPSYIERFGRGAYAGYARSVSTAFGPSLSPLHAFLLLQGLDTLSLRVERHVANSQRIAEYLAAQPEVESVDYAGLPGSPFHEIAKRYLPKGAGSVFAFTLRGGLQAARAFYDAVELFSRMTHIGDARSYILHPRTTTHARLPLAEVERAGVGEGLIRLSVGIETIDDLLADLDRGLGAVRAAR